MIRTDIVRMYRNCAQQPHAAARSLIKRKVLQTTRTKAALMAKRKKKHF